MSNVNSVSIYLRERLSHPLVGELKPNTELDEPLSCAQGKILADVIEEMWDHLPEDKQKELSEKMRASEFNALGPKSEIHFRTIGRRL
jgi:hypothetical protein